MKVNPVTAELAPYPMEELARIRGDLEKKGAAVYDFGTGDPRIPTPEPIRTALRDAIPETTRYPSIRGLPELAEAQKAYLQRRFGIEPDSGYGMLPTMGSKEAVFHTALSLVGRAGGRKHILYPDPGYPVYRNSTLLAGGVPYPVRLTPDTGFLLEPWNLPPYIQNDAAALWVNYPHNPTGAVATAEYWEKLVAWAQETDTILLCDDCYVDVYDAALDEDGAEDDRPNTALSFGTDRVLSFMSLSKRSGMTGYRCGFIAGDPEITEPLARARANYGVGTPEFIQAAACVAWADDEHVAERRQIFTERMRKVVPVLQELGMLGEPPRATFYVWARVPEAFGDNDVKFALDLAKKGVITSPSQWLGEGVRGFVRFALVPGEEETDEAMEVLRDHVNSRS